jgi:hypothetical protein
MVARSRRRLSTRLGLRFVITSTSVVVISNLTRLHFDEMFILLACVNWMTQFENVSSKQSKGR